MNRSVSNIQIAIDQRIMDALRVIDSAGAGIAFAVDDKDRVVGTLTDGDIRRALLKGASLDSPIRPYINSRFASVKPTAGRAEVLDLMQALTLHQVPIVDEQGTLKGVHLLHEIIGATQRSNWAVIMAGGKGTRLRPYTESIPKPMLKVAGRPILERLILHLMSCGVSRVFISVNYLAHVIEDHFGDGERLGCRISYLHENDPLGTGGALSLLPEAPSLPVVVLNGDLVTQVNLEEMLRFHAENKFSATMGIRKYTHQVPFGCVETDRGQILQLEEKPLLEKQVNAGVYVISPEVLQRIPKCFYPITDLFDECIQEGVPVGAYEIEEDWIDVGQHEQLKQARGG